jgi:hypothetical protein
VLVYATWPVYLLAWLMAVLRVPLAFRLTPKSPAGVLKPWWLLPQLLTALLLGAGVVYALTGAAADRSPLLVGFALVQCLLQAMLLWQWPGWRRWLPRGRTRPDQRRALTVDAMDRTSPDRQLGQVLTVGGSGDD